MLTKTALPAEVVYLMSALPCQVKKESEFPNKREQFFYRQRLVKKKDAVCWKIPRKKETSSIGKSPEKSLNAGKSPGQSSEKEVIPEVRMRSLLHSPRHILKSPACV